MPLRTLMETISSSWRWTKQRYPKLDLSARSKRRHVLLHLTKAVGGLNGQEERVDHGMPMDREEYRALIAKVVLSALQLADVESVSPDDLVKEVENILKEANS